MTVFGDRLIGSILPTRDGTAQGAGAERVMMNAVGGPDGIRTRIVSNPDGTTTMLRTRNGMPEFSATKAEGVVGEPGLKSPLTETSYDVRGYYDTVRLYGNEGIYSVLLRSVKSIVVVSGNIPPLTLTIAIAYRDTPASGALTDLVETARETVAGRSVQDILCTSTGATIHFVFDELYKSISFTWRKIKTKLRLDALVTAAENHGIFKGEHDLVLVTRPLGAVTKLQFKRRKALTRTEIILAGSGGFIENLCAEHVNKVGITYPVFRRLETFSPCIKVFKCSTGLYTNETRDVLVHPVTATAPVNSSIRPRRFDFSSNLLIDDAAPLKVCRDAVFNGDIYGMYCDPYYRMELSPSSHLFRQASGVVWLITIINNYDNAGHLHMLTVTLVGIYGRMFESVHNVYRTLATASLPNENVTYGAPPGVVPTDYNQWVRSLPNGTQAMYVNEHRCIARVDFADTTGAVDGGGITATITHITPLREYTINDTTPEEGTYFTDYAVYHWTVFEPVNMYQITSFETNHSDTRYKMNVYPTNENTWEFLTRRIVSDSTNSMNGSHLFSVAFGRYCLEWRTDVDGNRLLHLDPAGSTEYRTETSVVTLERGEDSVSQTTVSVYWLGVGTLSQHTSGTDLVSTHNPFQNEIYRLVNGDYGTISSSPPEAIVHGASVSKEAPYFFFHGELVPKDSPLNRIAINVRRDADYAAGAAVFVAADDASSGVFF